MDTVLQDPTTTRSKQGVPLPFVEVFRSVQGEGANAGRAAVFLRFSGCNANCAFADGALCDTPWQKARMKMTLEETLKWVYAQSPPEIQEDPSRRHAQGPMVILTGGEPTMNPNFDRLCEALFEEGWYVAVESNGSLWRDSLDYVDWLVVSPKHLVGHAMGGQNPEPNDRVIQMADEFRWVISGPDSEVPPFYAAQNSYALRYLSPALLADGTGKEWEDPAYMPRFAPGAVDRCMEIIAQDSRWRLSLQTHKWTRVR